LPSRIIGVKVRTAERRPAAKWTAFNVAARAMAFADGRTAIRAWSWSELFAHASLNGTTLSLGGLIIRVLSLLKIQTDKTFARCTSFGSGVHLYRLSVRPGVHPDQDFQDCTEGLYDPSH
jgi:hypothetical protein